MPTNELSVLLSFSTQFTIKKWMGDAMGRYFHLGAQNGADTALGSVVRSNKQASNWSVRLKKLYSTRMSCTSLDSCPKGRGALMSPGAVFFYRRKPQSIYRKSKRASIHYRLHLIMLGKYLASREFFYLIYFTFISASELSPAFYCYMFVWMVQLFPV